ncbi:MAG: hypothetical protein KA963_04235 [Candidatus Cloacimonas sp.]|nr:hypothetical protein [Candidatus Cloacimonas sp.]HNX02549.1 hypothetical protein [Candidatus Cloacimonas sp.]HPS59928.1 hypothetical protein [Candidatus Cloacimonas sp.]
MKKSHFCLSIVCLGLLLIPLGLNSLETKLSGEFWGRWIAEIAKRKDSNGNYDDQLVSNYLSLERGYLGLETKFTEQIKGRFTVDIFTTDKTYEYQAYSLSDSTLTSSAKSGSIDGAGLKIKYAYVDFGGLLPVKDMTLTAGMQKVYFGSIYDWSYTLIGKAPTDEHKVVNSSDLGITLNGFFPSGYGEYQLGIYNGEGYKKVGANLKENTDFAYLGNLRLTPITGVTVGGSYMLNTVGRDKNLDGETVNTAYEKQKLTDIYTRLAYGPVDLTGEYIIKDVDFPNVNDINKTQTYTATGISIFPCLNLKAYLPYDLQLVGYYDVWDESDRLETDKARSKLTASTIGINYNFLPDETDIPAMQLQLNYTDKKYDEDKSHSDYADGKKDSSQINLQLKWKFANTL